VPGRRHRHARTGSRDRRTRHAATDDDRDCRAAA
jgi:hypothetical protein